MTLAGKKAEAVQLRAEGLRYCEIAERLHAPLGTVKTWILDPDGSKLRERKRGYGGICQRCGTRTDGSNGRAKAPVYCQRCWPDARRVWTRDAVVEAIRQWAERYGAPPVAEDWQARGDSEWPSVHTVQRVWGSWNSGIEAAGFTPLAVGHRRSHREAA